MFNSLFSQGRVHKEYSIRRLLTSDLDDEIKHLYNFGKKLGKFNGIIISMGYLK